MQAWYDIGLCIKELIYSSYLWHNFSLAWLILNGVNWQKSWHKKAFIYLLPFFDSHIRASIILYNKNSYLSRIGNEEALSW
ncbi:unnamed protein product [Blepharisma stoltei]|uniref:Maturase K n=1 Tax=Blepharisma stoltei TaxID=1481888 RepID=A0AAU9JG07_9CILI|nr:unnamed protein product [Blepharisma stoltei]